MYACVHVCMYSILLTNNVIYIPSFFTCVCVYFVSNITGHTHLENVKTVFKYRNRDLYPVPSSMVQYISHHGVMQIDRVYYLHQILRGYYSRLNM